MKFTLYTSNTVGKLSNCVYPNKVVVTDEKSLIQSVQFDHVTASYKDFYRSNANFIEADNIPMDCDNDHSDNESEWVTPFEVAMAFPDVAFAVVYSRNNMKQKGSKSERFFQTRSIWVMLFCRRLIRLMFLQKRELQIMVLFHSIKLKITTKQ